MNNEIWNECFSQFRLMGSITQNILRNCAAQHLVRDGFDEVGSSDISHELFSMWRGAGGDWQKAILVEVDRR
jgi:hypothetical protein